MADADQNLSDILLDKYATHAFSILRVSAGLQADVLSMLTDLQKSLIADIEDHGPTPKLNALLKQATATIQAGYNEITQTQKKALETIAETESKQAANIANSTIRVSLMSPIQSKQTLEAIAGKSLVNGQYPSEWWKGQSQDLQNKFAAQMRMGMLKGESVDDLVKRVRGTKENGYGDGLMQASRSQAEALVRTSVQTVANEAKIATYRANDDVIKAIQWVSTLDSRTTPICFTESMRPLPLGEIRKMFRRTYKGKIVIITTASGQEIEATPNHPILTTRGWTTAEKIQPGDQVLNFTRDELVPVAEDVKMEPTFATLADAIFNPVVSQIVIERATPADFHGDGMAGDHEIEIAIPYPNLGERLKTVLGKCSENETLHWLHVTGSLRSDAGLGALNLTGLPAIMPALDQPMLTQSGIEAGFTDASVPNDVARTFIGLEAGKSLDQLGAGGISGKIVQEAEGLEEGRNGRGCGRIILRDGTGAFAISPTATDVIAIRIEDRACHVFNLETSTGVYLVEGSIVKNCRALDGCTWDLDFKPLTGGKAWPGPVAHWNCRSTQIPVTKSWAELSGKNVGATDEMINKAFQDKTGEKDALAKTRASMDGQVASKLNFDDWMKTKTVEFQDQVMGQQQATLWRQGKITMSDLTDQKNRPLTLTQLKDLVAANELIPPQTYAEGQAGLTMIARGALQSQLGILKEQKKVTTTFANENTGEMVTIQGTTPNQEDLKAVEKHEATTVLKTAVKPEETLSKPEVNLWGKLGVDKVHSVTPDGKVQTIKGQMTPAVAVEMTKALDKSQSIHPEAKLKEVAKAGGLIHSKSKEQEIKVPIQTSLEKPAFVKPTPVIAEPPVTKVTPATKEVKAGTPAAKLDARPNSSAGDREWPPLAETKVIKSLPGSTAPKLIEDLVTGRRFVQKTEPSNPGHVREEFYTDSVYRALGIKTPDSTLIESDQGPVKFAKFIEGGKTLEQLETEDKKAYAAAVKKIQKNFVADALLGNYDVVGLTKDNILVADKVPYRIDNGGGLRYRAQGKLKANFGPVVTELESMRDKNVNAASASVFGSIPEAEIQRQIKEIVAKKAKVLKALPEELRPLMEQRIKSLADRLHPEIVATASATGPSPEGEEPFSKFAARIDHAGVNGVSIKIDKGQIEDLQVLVWEEKNPQGKPITKAWLKLTEKGSKDAMDTLAPALPKGSRQDAQGLDKDVFWTQLKAFSSVMGVKNPDKTIAYSVYQKKALYDLQNQLTELLAGKPSKKFAIVNEINALPEEERLLYRRMARSYQRQIALIAPAVEAGQKIPAGARQVKMYQKPAVEPEAGNANGLRITETDLKFRATEIKDGKAKEVQDSYAYRIAQGKAYEIEAGTAQFQLIPYNPENAGRAYALQGTLTATLEGKATTEQVLAAIQSIGALGVESKPAEPAYQELLYLHRGVNLMKLADNTDYKAIMASKRTDEQKVVAVKWWLDNEHQIKLPAQPEGDYQPQGVVSSTDGFDRFYRWDLPRAKIEKELKGYGLHHSTSMVIDDFIGKVLDSGGEFTPTTQRLRKGIPLGATGGMSYDSDLATGGASYFFTRIYSKAQVSHGVRFKIGALARQDAITYKNDYFGKTNDSKFIQDKRQTTIPDYKLTAKGGGNETIFKNGLTMDDVDFIIAANSVYRDRVIKEFKDRGIEKMADGRTVEQVVLTVEEFKARK